MYQWNRRLICASFAKAMLTLFVFRPMTTTFLIVIKTIYSDRLHHLSKLNDSLVCCGKRQKKISSYPNPLWFCNEFGTPVVSNLGWENVQKSEKCTSVSWVPRQSWIDFESIQRSWSHLSNLSHFSSNPLKLMMFSFEALCVAKKITYPERWQMDSVHSKDSLTKLVQK